ncbi:putative entry exclusion protein TrbK-alt [Bradyrhizobium sp.]|uniref:putative entry exclusion protein TrbK-alt n=1 Tax=Bradyrhizobium sp. TaxID=376 RepID=UPI0026349ADD|nr:putative entry exclusion protein TrbK-alt [Bradyrhizobium sp.]
MAAAMLLVVFIVAACAIRLRDDEGQTPSATSTAQASDPLATKLAECRSVTDEQKDALSECRKAWAEKRRQFLGKTPSASSDSGAPQGGSSLFVPPKDEDRLPAGYPSLQQSGKE